MILEKSNDGKNETTPRKKIIYLNIFLEETK